MPFYYTNDASLSGFFFSPFLWGKLMFYLVFRCSFSNSQIFVNGSHSNWNCSFYQIDLCNVGRLSWWITAEFLNQAQHRESVPVVINILGIKLRIGRKLLCGLFHSVALSCSWGNRPLWLNGVINGITQTDLLEIISCNMYVFLCCSVLWDCL